MKNKITAIVLLLALLLSCVVLPVGASTEDISVLWANGDTVAKNLDGTPRGWTAIDHMLSRPDKTSTEHTISASKSFEFTLTAEQSKRLSIRNGRYGNTPSLKGIPSENMALSFWIYATSDVTLQPGLRIRIGGASDGGYELSPLTGAMAMSQPQQLVRGWNHFYIDMGKALTDPSYGVCKWVSEAGLFIKEYPGVDKQMNIGGYCYLDFYSIHLTNGSPDVKIYVDDIKFLNTARLDEAVQKVNSAEALEAVAADGTYKNIELCGNIKLTEPLFISNACSIKTNGYTITGKDALFVMPGVTATLDGKEIPAYTDDIPVSGVKLSANEMSVYEHNTCTLTANVLPASAANSAVTWASSDESILSVDQNGKCTAHKTGKATVTVTTKEGGFTASCEITVKPASKQLSFVNVDTPVSEWKFHQHTAGTGTTSQEITMSSSASFVGTWTASDKLRTTLRNPNGVSLASIPTENLAFSCYIYAEEDISLEPGFILQLGSGSDGGWRFQPAKGAFANNEKALVKGWNRLYIDIGKALSGDTSAGTVTYYKGAGLYESLSSINEATITYFDMYNAKLVAGSPNTKIYFDDAKFINTAYADEYEQPVNNESALRYLVEQTTTEKLHLTYPITLTDSLVITRDMTINADRAQLKGAQGKPLFIIKGADVTVREGNYRDAGTSCLFSVTDGGKLTYDGTVRISGTDEIIFDVDSGCTLQLEGATPYLLEPPTSVYPESFAGAQGYLLAKLPGGTAVGTLFDRYTKVSDDAFDYYFVATSTGDTPSDDTPSDDSPSDDTPSDDTPSDDTPSDDTPSEEKPSGNEGQEPTAETISDVPLYIGIGVATLMLILGCVLVVMLKKSLRNV